MEIIELSITAEESENYRKITNRLKVLGCLLYTSDAADEL